MPQNLQAFSFSCMKAILPLVISAQCSSSYENQPIDLQSKSTDWFLYDGEHWLLMC